MIGANPNMPLPPTQANLARYGLDTEYLETHAPLWLPSVFSLHLDIASDHSISYTVRFNSTVLVPETDPLLASVGRGEHFTGRGMQIQTAVESSIARVFSNVDIDASFQPFPEVGSDQQSALRVESMGVMLGLCLQLILCTAVAAQERERLVSMRAL
ncbi:hypothetical protein KIPB_014238, partial [Kipferlia bialata]|eukprot:g14238.t1